MTTTVAEHCRRIKALSAKLERAEIKAEQYQVAIAQHIAAVKKAEPKDWLTIIESECDLKKSRAYEYLAIADGRKTVEGVRAEKAESVRQVRSRNFPLRSGKAEEAKASKANGAEAHDGRLVEPTATDQLVEHTIGEDSTAAQKAKAKAKAEKLADDLFKAGFAQRLLDYKEHHPQHYCLWCAIKARLARPTSAQGNGIDAQASDRELPFTRRVRSAIEAAHFDGEVQESTCKAADRVQRVWAKLSTQLWQAYHEERSKDPEASAETNKAASNDIEVAAPDEIRSNILDTIE